MANTLNKIHYAVKIVTSSIKSSPSIGLHSGTFGYTTDGYVPSDTDTYEGGGTVNPDVWNTDLMSASGLSTLGSKIDIVSGGDYSFLQNATCKLVNKTNLGNTIHKTIESITGLSPLGSTMQVFAIIDGVWYSRWFGQVSGTSFDDKYYSFIGADEKSNSTDTINNTVIGLIDAEVEYSPLGDIKVDNLTAYRFFYGIAYGNNKNFFRVAGSETVSGVGSDCRQNQFNGLGTGSLGYVATDANTSISFFVKEEDSIIAGDFIKFASDDTIRVITFVNYRYLASGDKVCDAVISSIDLSSVDYTFLFGDPDDQFGGDVHDNLETIASEGDGEKCYFQLYKSASDTGITGNLPNDGTIDVVKGESTFSFTYTTNADGGIVITKDVEINKIQPTKVRTFGSDVELFASTTRTDWTVFETELANSTELTLSNDMSPASPYTLQGDLYTDNSNFKYYVLTFNTSDIDGKEDLQIGSMLKGVFNDAKCSWEPYVPWGGVEGFWGYDVSNSDGDFGDGQDSAVAFASTQRRWWILSQYNIIRDRRLGRIPLFESETRIPNVLDNADSVTDVVDSKEFHGTSLPATNMEVNELGVISIHDKKNFNIQHQTDGDGDHFYMAGEYSDIEDAEPKYYSNDDGTTDILVSIQTANAYAQTVGYKDSLGDRYTVNLNDASRQSYLLNGFCLYETCRISGATTTLTYKASNADGYNSYRDLLDELSGGDTTALGSERDAWDAGLQVTEQQQRYNLVTNLCKQGFVGGYTNRSGIDTYKLIGDTAGTAFDVKNDNTLRNSIKGFKTSPIASVYNEFEIKGNFTTIAIKNVVETSFPLFGEDYSDYVTGIDVYATAKQYWEKARSSYLTTKAIHKAPTNRTNLEFASNQTYAEEYLALLLEWSTVPKLQLNCSLPVTPETIVLEQLDYVHFSDKLITPDNNEFAEGWITSIRVVPSKSIVEIELTLSPDYLINPISSCGTITESGSNTDTITEDASNTDTITETACQ